MYWDFRNPLEEHLNTVLCKLGTKENWLFINSDGHKLL